VAATVAVEGGTLQGAGGGKDSWRTESEKNALVWAGGGGQSLSLLENTEVARTTLRRLASRVQPASRSPLVTGHGRRAVAAVQLARG
jgi:hypothetical protein